MDRTWTWRDWIFLLLFFVLGVLIFFQILQNDRQYERLNRISDDFREFRRLVERGRIGSVPTDNTTAEVPSGGRCTRNTVEPATLNPITAKDAYESLINGYVLESLLDRNNETLKLEPNLCESYEISDDKLQYTFHLRRDVRWHDGEPFTADDILFSYQTMMNPKVDCQNIRNYYQDIEKLEKLDDHTVRFTYKKVYWRGLTICGSISIVPKHVFGYDKPEDFNVHPAGRHPIGTGPYRFQEWVEGQHVTLVRNPDYWNKKKAPHLDRLVFKFIIDETQSIEQVKKQQIDYYGCSIKQWFRDAEEPAIKDHFQRFTIDSLTYNYIGWNQKTPFFNDRRVRRAMTHAIPRQKFLQTRMRGLGQVVTGNFYAKSAAYNGNIKPWPHDLAKASELLEKAGWKDSDGDGIRDREGRPFKFQLLMPSGRRETQDLADTVKAELKKIGVVMTIGARDWASFITELDQRNFEAVTLGWRLVLEPDPYQIWHSSQTGPSGSNFVNFVNQEADEIIERARREFDEEKRNPMFHRFHEIIHYEQPYTFLFNRPSLLLVHNRYQNVKQYPLSLDVTEWWVRSGEQRLR